MTQFQMWKALKQIAKINKGPLRDGDCWSAINAVLEKIGLGYKQ